MMRWVWPHVSSSSETRVGPRCEHYDECFVTRMRRRAEKSGLIIVNHHLFFADLRARAEGGYGTVLPDYDAVVFDEAHQIEDAATQFFGWSVASTHSKRWFATRSAVFVRTGFLTREPHCFATYSLEEPVFSKHFLSPARLGRVALGADPFDGALEERYLALDAALDGVAAFAERRDEQLPGVGQVGRRTHQLRESLATVAEAREGGVRWVERQGRRTVVGASPVDLSGALREELFFRAPSVVLTSATLTTDGSFEFVKNRWGLDFEVEELTLDSPFDYEEQAAPIVPATSQTRGARITSMRRPKKSRAWLRKRGVGRLCSVPRQRQ